MEYKCKSGFISQNLARTFTYGDIITSYEYGMLSYEESKNFEPYTRYEPSKTSDYTSYTSNDSFSPSYDFTSDSLSSNSDYSSSNDSSSFDGGGGGDSGGGGSSSDF